MARVVVLGMSGTGKSYYAGYLLEQKVPAFDLAVHYDVEDEEKGLSVPDRNPLYGTLYVDQERYARLDFLKVIYNHRRVRIVPEGLTGEELRDLYGVICKTVMTLCKDVDVGTAFVSCDEAHNVVPNEAIDERVERLITGGRKHGVECLHISQRPQLLHKTCISQADRRIYFSVQEQRDLDKIDRNSNFPARKLKALGERSCIVENKDTGEWDVFETDDIPRERPHYSGDDGILDDALPV